MPLGPVEVAAGQSLALARVDEGVDARESERAWGNVMVRPLEGNVTDDAVRFWMVKPFSSLATALNASKSAWIVAWIGMPRNCSTVAFSRWVPPVENAALIFEGPRPDTGTYVSRAMETSASRLRSADSWATTMASALPVMAPGVRESVPISNTFTGPLGRGSGAGAGAGVVGGAGVGVAGVVVAGVVVESAGLGVAAGGGVADGVGLGAPPEVADGLQPTSVTTSAEAMRALKRCAITRPP